MEFDPPETLTGLGRKKWIEILEGVDGSENVNLDILHAYCRAYARWMQMEQWLADPENGIVVTITDDKGNIKTHGAAPQFSIAERSCKEMSRLGKILGLNA